MPAVWARHVQRSSVVLEAREWRQTVGQSGMTPTAFAFLIPVFVFVVFAPFLCVFCIRKRRHTVAVAPKTKKPALRRAEARERLNAVTQVSNVTESTNASSTQTAEPQPEVAPSSASTSGRECAICLSTIHAPSPPEPARIAATQPSDEAATRPPSINDVSPEAILKLNVCGHEFHAECLVSWVVLRKTSCPICRAVYITKEEMMQYDEEASLAMTPTTDTTATTAVPGALAGTQDPAALTVAATTNSAPTNNWNTFWRGDANGVSVSGWRYFWRGENSVPQGQRGANNAAVGESADAVPLEQVPRRSRFWQRTG